MILVVGHGPSSDVDPEWVDSQDFVVRLYTGRFRDYKPHIGTKIDVIVVTRPKKIFEGYDFWLESDYREMCQKYSDKKLSTGTVGCLIARHLYPDEEIGVIGFDATLRGVLPEMGWPYHDEIEEGRILRSIGVSDYGEDIRV